MTKPIEIFTDGACRGNPGPGGWGVLLRMPDGDRELKGGETATTNNRMELMAAIMALEALDADARVVLHTDSQYVKNGITEWIHGWKRRGWTTVAKTPVKNADLWRRLDEAANRHQVKWNWVRGHAGTPGNERADKLAGEGLKDALRHPLETTSIEIFTDGACQGNPGPGGWGVLLRMPDGDRELKGGETATTNNRMELMAAIMALEALDADASVILHTDSQYVKNGISEWIHGWKRRGWTTVAKTPVKNADLWRRLDEAANRHQVKWNWVRGHAGTPGNERADKLAGEGLKDALRHPQETRSIEIFTDGACQGNPGPGGWGVLLRMPDGDRELKGGETATTNNRMELMAAIMALEALNADASVVLHTDSQYVKNGITEWIRGWKRRGWTTVAKTPVKNADLWRRLDEAANRHQVKWNWVRGHAGTPGNERADRLAAEGLRDALGQSP